jgi:glutamate synthase (NADPH/NADH) large chain/glutamate synthase (ferredoxin)
VHAEQIVLDSPVLDGEAFRRLLSPSRAGPELAHVDITWPASEGAGGMAPALERIVSNAQEAIAAGARVLVLSDRTVSEERVALPSLLAVAAVHAQLVRDGTRLEAGVVLDSGEPREVHHFACLIGFGATAVHPYLLLETAGDDSDAVLDALAKGLLKVMSKLGISSVSSYRGAQAFEAVGLAREVIDAHFPGTGSRLAGAGLERIAADAFGRHADAFAAEEARLPVGGVLNWRRDGERHMWSPATVVRLRDAARDGGAEDWERFRDAADAEAAGATLRGLLELRAAPEPLPLDDVEPATEIVKRFATGAMSLGSISPEAHETLAIAMNRLGGKSNTGEGGEDPRRFTADENGDLRRSAIKQVASARFGVTIDYLVNADELQIKIAQGAKPGEGGQLPGHKVDDFIGRLRHSTPSVELISPPPHHDIYSIEDIKQLIHDLRCANPEARISVKLAAELGVGTVAAGVVKAHTEHLVIAGHDGGTGASPVSSIQAAGIPWELGLAETQQTLVANGLRERVVLQVDGGLKTGRDVVVGALLGAEEFGFSTAPLIALGCIMMRVCHLNTCPVGIATQDPELRRRFDGQPEHVTRYLLLVAEDARRHMARLGVARFDDLIGRPDLLDGDTAAARAAAVDLGDVLAVEEGPARHRPGAAVIPRPDPLDIELFEAAQPAIERGERISFRAQIRNVDRSIGARLSGAAAKAKWHGSVDAEFHGSAGQSFGAWLAPGIEFSLVGEANDYAGKGLSGGVLAVRLPSPNPGDVIVGNTVLYGATSGRAFFAGVAGERFAVRNSGAWAVAEGVGDHGCEYMTGGRVAVLGRTGRNFAAGMTGGAAWVLDDDGGFALRCNRELVELSDLDDADADELWGLLGEHVERTGSPLAADLLADWAHAVRNFVSVVPRGYREALEEERAHEKVAA